ncbi:unnamed protein product [Vicia faba]|uniref:Uncharacterized protein n=1 Tax=Vicia faba TaxID=3906 RepID=A0AAV0Z816_VICFA|nr:unnamed protein product [Vicia faba]
MQPLKIKLTVRLDPSIHATKPRNRTTTHRSSPLITENLMDPDLQLRPIIFGCNIQLADFLRLANGVFHRQMEFAIGRRCLPSLRSAISFYEEGNGVRHFPKGIRHCFAGNSIYIRSSFQTII